MTWFGVALLFATLTAAMMWPIVRDLGTAAPQHQDVYFNMWRLRWLAHALHTSPAHLFDANIFYPEKDTLAYSDAMLVEGLLAAPFSGLNPVAVHNLMILAPIAASAVAIFALCRHLTGSRGAGIVAATAFAFAPFRFEHIMHMEIQWTIWMPLAFLTLHRLCETGRWRYGVAIGACVALQMLSCIYYGIFLAVLLAVGAALLWASDCQVSWRRALPALAAGAAIAVVVSAVYAIPYQRVHTLVGDRPIEEVHLFSAQPANYLSAPAGNWLYGRPGRPGHGERRLFPGSIVTLLALAGLFLRRPTPRLISYLLLLALAFDMSLGFSGITYPALARFIGAFRSLRALARLGIFVVMFLSVLAAYGYTMIACLLRPLARTALCGAIVGAMLVEYRTTFAVTEFETQAPAIYRILARQPRGVVAELPAPKVDHFGFEGRLAYLSTFYWFPIITGYSGNFPPSFLERMDRLRDFPSERALRQLRRDNVAYVVVHTAGYDPTQRELVYASLKDFGMADLGEFTDGEGLARLYSRR
jgi:hypothetical protein